jgi:hypothetical protein
MRRSTFNYAFIIIFSNVCSDNGHLLKSGSLNRRQYLKKKRKLRDSIEMKPRNINEIIKSDKPCF